MSHLLAKVTILVSLFLVTLLFITPLAIAYDPLGGACGEAAQGTDFCQNVSQDQNRTIVYGNNNIFVRIIQVIVLATGAISVIMIVLGGLRYLTSGGDSNAIKGAKDTVMYAVVGLIVTIFAQTIVAFVLSRFK